MATDTIAKPRAGAPPSKAPPPKPAAASHAPAKKKTRRVLFVAVLAVLALAIGGGVYVVQHGANAKPGHEVRRVPTFVALEQFTVNLLDREHYLQLGVTYEVGSNADAEVLKTYMPILRSRILLLLASKDVDDLAHPAGKTKLAEELVGEARKAVPGSASAEVIRAVHFSAFVIQ